MQGHANAAMGKELGRINIACLTTSCARKDPNSKMRGGVKPLRLVKQTVLNAILQLSGPVMGAFMLWLLMSEAAAGGRGKETRLQSIEL